MTCLDQASSILEIKVSLMDGGPWPGSIAWQVGVIRTLKNDSINFIKIDALISIHVYNCIEAPVLDLHQCCQTPCCEALASVCSCKSERYQLLSSGLKAACVQWCSAMLMTCPQIDNVGPHKTQRWFAEIWTIFSPHTCQASGSDERLPSWYGGCECLGFPESQHLSES